MAPGSIPAAVRACARRDGAVVELAPGTRGGRPARWRRVRAARRRRTPRASRSSSPLRSLPCCAVEVGSLTAPIPWAHATARRTAAHSPAAVAPAGPARAVGPRRSARPAPHARRDPRPPGRAPARCRGRAPGARERARPRCSCRCSKRTATCSVILTKRPGDDAVAPGRDRVPGRQARSRARRRPPGHGAARGARGDRPRSRRCRDRGAARGDLDGRVALRDHAVRRVPARTTRR